MASPIASSSTHPFPCPPPTPRRSSRRQIARPTMLFVLALALPYVSANPVPSPSHHRPRLRLAPSTAASSSSRQSLAHLFLSVGERIARRGNSSTAPILEIATYDPYLRAYTLPSTYVKLDQGFNAGFIVLAYIIAFVGSLCTLELLLRRTTNSGWRNKALLAAAGVCFGGVSTFAMHFIFNNSLTLKHPLHSEYPEIYLAYDAGFTVLSLVVSCMAMTIAFFVMGTKLTDWSQCFKRKRTVVGRSAAGVPAKSDADEYREWKSTHKKMMRRGTLDIGRLSERQSNWSAIDPEENQSQRASILEKLSFASRRKSPWNEASPGVDPSEDKDRRDLAELEFRLGKDAVRDELERRVQDRHLERVPTSQTSASYREILSHDYATSTRSPSRRNSIAAQTECPDIFASNFIFPPRSSLSTPPPPLAQSTCEDTIPTPQSESPLSQPYALPARIELRRASLPVNILLSRNDRQSCSGPPALARIQSLPEGDFEPASATSHRPSQASHMSGSVSQSSDDIKESDSIKGQHQQLGRDKSSTDVQRLSYLEDQIGARGKLGTVLGFDVVTGLDVLKIFVTGITAGFGVVGMHYIGQASIVGIPYVAYKPAYVVGSVIIACGAVVIALYIMFIMLRPKLKHTWLSKMCVAMILATAVIAMHFCGMMGTIYGWPANQGTSHHSHLTGTNLAITGVVAALAFAACMACAVFFVLQSLHQRREQARRRRVVVASIMFDDRNRVLVSSTDGMLPMCDIANLNGGVNPNSAGASFLQSLTSEGTVLGMDLSTGHDAFVSALKMTWGWKNLQSSPIHHTLPSESRNSHGMQSQTESTLGPMCTDSRRPSGVSNNGSTVATGNREAPISHTTFLDKFASSSAQLATRLTGQMNGVTRLGVLYDQILTTGWVKLQNSNDTVTKGQLIFLVRRINSAAERFDLQTRHFIFADPAAVAAALQRTLSVPFDHIMPLLEDARSFCDSTLHCTPQPGKLYAGVAVVQATPFDGLRIMLENDKRSQLPMREMCTFGAPPGEEGGLSGTVEEIGEVLSLLGGLSLLGVITRNIAFDVKSDEVLSERIVALLAGLERAIVPMLDQMLSADDMTHVLTRLTINPVLIALTPGGRPTSSSKRPGYTPPYAIIFYANYDAAVNTFSDKWLPFSLFRAQNACVMAQMIQVGMRMERIWTDLEEETSLQGAVRRPSRVQFDVHSHEQVLQPQPQPQGWPMFDTGIFNSFSFPPKGDPSATSDSAVPGHIQRRSSLIKTSGPSVMRKSSLARSRFDSFSEDSSEGGGGSSHGAMGLGIGGVVADSAIENTTRLTKPGVGVWDQDWLLDLLRSKLKAEA